MIEPTLQVVRPEVLLEIGSDEGGNTNNLLEYCEENDARLHVIDPLPKYDVSEWRQRYGERLVFHEDLSLNALPKIEGIDVGMIDGDHNWYTVFNELRLIEERCSELSHPFPLLILHDVGWPYGRRDLYYDPDTVPEEYRKPHERKGMRPDSIELVDRGGLNARLPNALREGETRGGVLTAVEDFLKETEQDLELVVIPGVNGLGILAPLHLKEHNAEFADHLEELKLPKAATQLIEVVERDRLETLIRQQQYRAAFERIQERRSAELDGHKMRLRAKERQNEELRNRLIKLERDAGVESPGKLEDVELLIRCINRLDNVISVVLNSRRWKIARAVSGFARKVLRKPAEPRVPVEVRRIREEFGAWRRDFENKSFSLETNEPERMSDTPATVGRETSADIVICVHNALEDVRRCLESVVANTQREFTLYLVNDGSDEPTSEYLRSVASSNPSCVLLESSVAEGYTKAANKGLHASSGDYVVLLNSDTVVPKGWLERLLECGERSSNIGIIGPLSNAASWQSVPELQADGDWAVNPLPEGYNVDDLAKIVESASEKRFPRVPLLNGFCLVVKRTLVEAIGYMDEETFPEGYGEENDYCLRAKDAGFELAVADHAYVYHAKSKSYSHERRRSVRQARGNALQNKHGAERVARSVELMRGEPTLREMRELVRAELRTDTKRSSKFQDSPFTVLFLLPDGGIGGGVHSIVQEAGGMRDLGVRAEVAVPDEQRNDYLRAYPTVDDSVFHFFDSRSRLPGYAASFDVVVATTFRSVALLREACEESPSILPAYYIQDYEPWFVRPGTPLEGEAKASYTMIPDALFFAKTEWLRETLKELHDIEVKKVNPSLDQSLYYPAFRTEDEDVVRVVAMVRPKTPRRAPEETMRILKALKNEYGERVSATIFGCDPQDPRFTKLTKDFEFENRGILRREEVAELLRSADVFLDLSKYQAFGRTGLEAMACGCATVLPINGGTSEYARDRENALLVDTTDFDAMVHATRELMEDESLRRNLSKSATLTASGYNVRRAAISELVLFQDAIDGRGPGHNKTQSFISDVE